VFAFKRKAWPLQGIAVDAAQKNVIASTTRARRDRSAAARCLSEISFRIAAALGAASGARCGKIRFHPLQLRLRYAS